MCSIYIRSISRATVAEDYKTFWDGITSGPIRIVPNENIIPESDILSMEKLVINVRESVHKSRPHLEREGYMKCGTNWKIGGEGIQGDDFTPKTLFVIFCFNVLYVNFSRRRILITTAVQWLSASFFQI